MISGCCRRSAVYGPIEDRRRSAAERHRDGTRCEKQRVAVARACILSPSVLFFDEPTSALDLTSTQEVANLIEDIAKRDIAVVIITHDEAFCNMLNAKEIVIVNGQISK